MSNQKKDGGPAFPLPINANGTVHTNVHGMSLRDYFAAKAMAELMDEWGMWKPNTVDSHRKRKVPITEDGYPVTLPDMGEEDIECLTRYSYQFADAMLKAREQ